MQDDSLIHSFIHSFIHSCAAAAATRSSLRCARTFPALTNRNRKYESFLNYSLLYNQYYPYHSIHLTTREAAWYYFWCCLSVCLSDNFRKL